MVTPSDVEFQPRPVPIAGTRGMTHPGAVLRTERLTQNYRFIIDCLYVYRLYVRVSADAFKTDFFRAEWEESDAIKPDALRTVTATASAAAAAAQFSTISDHRSLRNNVSRRAHRTAAVRER